MKCNEANSLVKSYIVLLALTFYTSDVDLSMQNVALECDGPDSYVKCHIEI
jgi:hypothetical protein